MALDGLVGAGVATSVWDAALAASWGAGPVWFHGDVAADNLLLHDVLAEHGEHGRHENPALR